MRNEKLRGVFENLGLQNVQTVISSGNVLFKTKPQDTKTLETAIEKALPEQLGFTSAVIVLSRQTLQEIADRSMFANKADTHLSNLLITFAKDKPATDIPLPHQVKDKGYSILGIHGRAIFSLIDLTTSKTPDLMRWLEKNFGKNITTRTWGTVGKILQKMNDP